MLRLAKIFALIFILISFITQSLGQSGIMSRITPPDIFGAIAIIFFILSGQKLNASRYYYISVLIIVFLIGGIVGLKPLQSLEEVIILFFLFLIFMIIIKLFNSLEGIKQVIYYFAWAGILASIVGIYDYIASLVGLPRLFPAGVAGEITSGFRNAGQAGAYALMLLSVLIPVRSSKFFDYYSWRQKRIITYSVVLLLLFLFLTGKISAYIGFAIGLAGFTLLQRNYRSFIMVIITGTIFLYLFNNLELIAPDVANRIVNKYESRLGGAISGEDSYFDDDNFYGRNIKDAFEAFSDSPLTGTGIGGFAGTYSNYEIHSTYFKILGETGILGVFAYIFFMGKFLNKLKFRSRKEPLQEFIYYLVPFVIGCLVSWAYTYHVRKREFWIMFAIIVVVNQLIINDKYYKSVEKNTN